MKRLIGNILFLLTLFQGSYANGYPYLHDFHTSLTEMRYNAANNSFEITIRVFTDDLQKALEESSGRKDMDIEESKSDIEIANYLKRHFAFIKEKDVRFPSYLGKEVESDATWLYLEIREANKLTAFNILNNIFFELFEDQNNLLNILFHKKRDTLIFSKDKFLQAYPL